MNVILKNCAKNNQAFKVFEQQMVNEIINQVRPHQIVNFIPKFVQYQHLQIFKVICAKIPTYTIYLRNLSLNSTINWTFLLKPRSSSLYLVLDNFRDEQSSSRNLIEVLEIIIKFPSQAQRPKVLVILFAEEVEVYFTKKFKIFFDYAWSLKFLDVTIILARNNESPVVLTFNPFENIINVNSEAERFLLFPDKLVNVHNYSIDLHVADVTRFLEIKKNDRREIIDIVNVYYSEFIKPFLTHLNFHINFVEDGEKNIMNYLENSVKKLSVESNSFVPFFWPHTASGKEHAKFVETKCFEFLDYQIFVPNTRQVFYKLIEQLVIELVIYFSLCASISLLGYFVKFSSDWNFETIFKILLGMVKRLRTSTSVEKILFFTLSFLSMNFTALFIQCFFDLEKHEKLVVFKNFEEVLGANLPIYGFNQMFKDSNFTNQSVAFNKIIDKIEIIQLQKSYIINIKKPFILIGANFAAAEMNAKLVENNFTDLVVPSNISFFKKPYIVPLEVNSPFAEKFDTILYRLYSSGAKLAYLMEPTNKIKGSTSQRKNEFGYAPLSIKSNASLEFVMLSFLMSNFLAFVVFILECLSERKQYFLNYYRRIFRIDLPKKTFAIQVSPRNRDS